MVSGACAVLIGPAAAWPALAVALAFLWGFTVVADSAQFSACVVSLSPPDYVGTMLTVQTSMGFLLTAVTIGLLPLAMGALGPAWGFALLGIGPLLGAVAMWRLAPMLAGFGPDAVGGMADLVAFFNAPWPTEPGSPSPTDGADAAVITAVLVVTGVVVGSVLVSGFRRSRARA